MNADGSKTVPLTNGIWEDGMPLYVPNAILCFYSTLPPSAICFRAVSHFRVHILILKEM
jgi:hypothetical protein